jgi:hypothetical protein
MLCRDNVETDGAVLRIILAPPIGLAMRTLRDTALRVLSLHEPHFSLLSECPRTLRHLPQAARRDSSILLPRGILVKALTSMQDSDPSHVSST